MKKRKLLSTKSMILFAAAGILLAGSAVGSASATLNYTSAKYDARMQVSKIGVTLNENGTAVSSNGSNGPLLEHLKEEKIIPGKTYKEEISVTNSGEISTYVRVILTKSWTKPGSDKKSTELSPELIELGYAKGSGWFIDPMATTDERVILYYSNPLEPQETTSSLLDTIKIQSQIGEQVEVNRQQENGNEVLTYVYKYDGYEFHVDAEVDAVQKNNGVEAMKSAWGVDVTLNGDTISMPNQQLQ